MMFYKFINLKISKIILLKKKLKQIFFLFYYFSIWILKLFLSLNRFHTLFMLNFFLIHN